MGLKIYPDDADKQWPVVAHMISPCASIHVKKPTTIVRFKGERDKTRPSRIPPLSPEVAERVVALTLAGPPPTASHWTGAAMAKAAGISVSSVQRIWRAHGLRPHLVRRFKLSNDPQFAAKLKEIVGLYVNPPNHAIVLSVDEKSQIQALDRTQPGLPMKKGRAGTITHDYKSACERHSCRRSHGPFSSWPPWHR